MSLLPPLTTDLQRSLHCDGDGQKCDAKYPCAPCAELDGGSDCMYERSSTANHIREKLPAAVQPFLSSFESEPSPSGSSPLVNSQGTSLLTSDVTSSDICDSAPASVHANSSRVPPEPDAANPPTAQEGSISETQLVPFREPPKPYPHQSTTASSFFLPSLRFPSIPRQLHTPLSSFGPGYFQVSDTTSSELDLSLCVFLRLHYQDITGTNPV